MKNTLLIICLISSAVVAQQKPEVGIAHSLQQDSLLYASGYRYIVENVQNLFSPMTVTDEQFERNLIRIKKSKLKIYAVNVFIPGELKVVGPDVDEARVLGYCERVFQRCQAAGVGMIVWGSGGSRRIPDGIDRGQARTQFVSIARKIAEVASKYKLTLALENLNSSETNFINLVEEAISILRSVNHPNLKLCADIYHMLRENEGPTIIEQAGHLLIHCDIAEKANRQAPTSEDFTPYLRALRKIKYQGKIIIEGRWENLEKQAATSFQYLTQQIDSAYQR